MNTHDRYWKQFLNCKSTFVSENNTYYEAFHFGDKEDATELAELVKSDIKTTTCSLKWVYDFENKPLPKSGDQSIIIDGNDHPVCIIETTSIEIKPFNEVNEQFAFDGGEGDRTLSSWRKIYEEYIAYECARIGREPTHNIPLVCERFKVIYKEELEDF